MRFLTYGFTGKRRFRGAIRITTASGRRQEIFTIIESMASINKRDSYFATKRAIDIAAAVLSVPLWLPVMALIALCVRVSMGQPVLFVQRRAGLRGRIFKILKFRTMRDGDGPEEVRITVLGRFLRKTGLDEIPQVINILKGDMSIVGPRPLLPEYLPLYTPEQMRRHDVRPGVTGWAQINGRNAVTWEERFAMDVWYADHASLALDAKIAAKTVLRLVFAPFSARAGDERIMPPFAGRGAS